MLRALPLLLAFTSLASPPPGAPTLEISGVKEQYGYHEPVVFEVTNRSTKRVSFYCDVEILFDGKWYEWGFRLEDDKRNKRKIVHDLEAEGRIELAWRQRWGSRLRFSTPGRARLKLVVPGQQGHAKDMSFVSREFSVTRN